MDPKYIINMTLNISYCMPTGHADFDIIAYMLRY